MLHYGNAWRLKAGPWTDPLRLNVIWILLQKMFDVQAVYERYRDTISVTWCLQHGKAVWNAVFIQIYSYVCLAICNTEMKFKDGMEEVDCNWN